MLFGLNLYYLLYFWLPYLNFKLHWPCHLHPITKVNHQEPDINFRMILFVRIHVSKSNPFIQIVLGKKM